MARETFASAYGPPPAGPYSHVVTEAGLLFLSGQIALDAEGRVVGETAAEQARAVLENIRPALRAAGADMDRVVKTTIFVTDMTDFAAVNEVYAEFFAPPYPARSTVGVAALPKGLKVEIEAIALR